MIGLQVDGLTKRFAGIVAVDGVDLAVPEGQRHAVIGPNGAGKSTLLAMIAGTLKPTRGRVHLLGRDVTGTRPHDIARLGVSRTFQHSGRFNEESLLDNCLLAARAVQPRNRLARLGRDRELRDAAVTALDAVGLANRADHVAGELSHGEARQLEIAMALAQRPRLLLADEPLAGLSTIERSRISGIFRELDPRVTVVFIEHDLEFVLDIADRITVLDFGEVIASGTPAEIRLDSRVAEVYLGTTTPSVGSAAKSAPRQEHGDRVAVLRTAGLRAGYGDAAVLNGIDLEAHKGRVLAVLGRNGMGKSTLLKTIMGIVGSTAGSVHLLGDDITATAPSRRANAGIALVPQGRGILPGLTVAEQLLVGHRPGRWTEERVYERFPILSERRKQLATTLSGGEQQMLAIGRALLRNPAALLLDEPSEGLAPQLVARVGDIVSQLADDGETIVLAEQNVRMALAVADDVVVLDRGHISYRGIAAEIRDDPTRQQELLGL